jgi:hypothetical protein
MIFFFIFMVIQAQILAVVIHCVELRPIIKRHCIDHTSILALDLHQPGLLGIATRGRL